MLAVGQSQLDNGMSVVTVEQPHLHSTAVSLLVNVGSRHETQRQWGLTHLLEHMLFRGSRGYPDTLRLARAIERHGGALQASTWRDHTQISTPLHPSRLREALAVLADMIGEPRFCDLALERSIVEAELLQDLDERGRDIDLNNLSRASIWQDHPMGRRIAGSFESVRSFSERDIRAHHERHYVGENAVLCVAGRVSHDETLAIAAEAFAKLPRGSRTENGEAARFAPRAPLRVVPREGSELEVQLTFEALPDLHQDFAALSLLTRVLDDGHASRLQGALCQQRGLVYELSTGLDCYADCGLYDIEMRVPPRRAASAVAATLDALAQLCEEGITDEELELARERSLHDLEFSIDSSEDLAARFGAAALFSHPEPLDAQIRALTRQRPEDLLRVARQMFLGGRLHATVLGPVERANMKRIERLFGAFPPGR